MNLLSSRSQFNTDSNGVNKIIPINNNNNNNNNIINKNNVVFSDHKNKFTSSDHAVISKGTITDSNNIESDIVMVTYTFNGSSSSSLNSSTSTLTTSTIQGSISGSTLPMRLKINGDRLILLRKETDIYDDIDGLVSISDGDSSLGLIKSSKSINTASGISVARRAIDEYRTVELIREKSVGFGLNIKGGCEHGLPILISGLTKEGPADRSRQLFIGDAIVRINNTTLSLTTTTHEEAIRLLKKAGVEVTLTVKHFKMISPFLTKCWRKRETLDNEAGNLMVSNTGSNSGSSSTETKSTCAISGGITVNNNNNNGLNSKPEKGKASLESHCDLKVTRSSGKLVQSSFNNNNINSDNNNNHGKEKGKVKKDTTNLTLSNVTITKGLEEEEEEDDDKWIPLISIDLGACFVTKYIHDSDKIRPQSFEIRWLTNTFRKGSNFYCPSRTTTTSGTSSPSSSTTSLSTPKSADSGVGGVGTIKCTNSNSTIKSNGSNFKESSSTIMVDNNNDTIRRSTTKRSKTYSSAIVICNNKQIYSQWFDNIEKSVKNVTNRQIALLNQYLPRNEKILFMGWVNQGLPSTSSDPHRPCYHWYTRYLVIKGGDALIYIKPPQGLLCTSNNYNSSSKTTTNSTTTFSNTTTSSSSSSTTTTTTPSDTSSLPPITPIRWSEGQPYLFKAYQSVLRVLGSSEYVDERENCFLLLSCDTNFSSAKSPLTSQNKTSLPTTRTTTTADNHSDEKSDLTNNPIVSETSNESTPPTTVCYLSVETPSELVLIRNNWNRATHQSVTQLGSKSFPVTCFGKLGNLILDYRYGFTFIISTTSTTTTTGHPHSGEPDSNWSFKFSQLKTSSDDGQSTLWLSFKTMGSSSSSVTCSPSSSTSSRYEINNERLRRLTVNPVHNAAHHHHERSSETLTHSSTSSITTADNPNPIASSSSSSSASSFSSSPAGSLLSSNHHHHHHHQQQQSIGKQFTIETREIKTNQLQHLLYCIHAFLTAKVISVDQSFIC